MENGQRLTVLRFICIFSVVWTEVFMASDNALTGTIPETFGNLGALGE